MFGGATYEELRTGKKMGGERRGEFALGWEAVSPLNNYQLRKSGREVTAKITESGKGQSRSNYSRQHSDLQGYSQSIPRADSRPNPNQRGYVDQRDLRGYAEQRGYAQQKGYGQFQTREAEQKAEERIYAQMEIRRQIEAESRRNAQLDGKRKEENGIDRREILRRRMQEPQSTHPDHDMPGEQLQKLVRSYQKRGQSRRTSELERINKIGAGLQNAQRRTPIRPRDCMQDIIYNGVVTDSQQRNNSNRQIQSYNYLRQ